MSPSLRAQFTGIPWWNSGAYVNATSRLYEPGLTQGWKMLTPMCKAPLANTSFLASWVDGYDALLRNVSTTFSKVYASLLSTLGLSHIHRLQHIKLGCTIEHQFLHECGCVGQGNTSEPRQLDSNIHMMNAAHYR